ncbi:hypothetical protein D3C87_2175780 [compost metagenome]
MSPPVSQTPVSAASTPIGTIMMIAIGRVRLSYCAASTRNTRRSARGKTTTLELPARICW